MGVAGRLVTVADGERVWQYETRIQRLYVQEQERAIIQLRTHGPLDPVTALASPQVPLSELFRVTGSVDSGEVRVHTLVPRRSVPNYDTLRLALAPDGRTPAWAESLKAGRPVARIVFREWRRNPALPESSFRFTTPRGVRPIVIP